MITLDQIKLLETKITKAINFVAQLTDENNELKKRNAELEETVASLKDEKTRVQEGIVSALGKLNQFEDAIERSLSAVKNNPKPAQSGPAHKAGTAAPARSVSQSEAAPQPRSAEQPRPMKQPEFTEQTRPIKQPEFTEQTRFSEQTEPVPEKKPKPAAPSVYMVDEEPEEESNEAELDIF